ncbi:MAG: trypsin-like peptidase domain-containing protein [Moorea sp. SIO3G5]|nr:trypsin-like peptidase domain-containing protein [Moorena sp. SIO3G5]
MNWNLKNLDWKEPEKEFEELSVVHIQSTDPKKTNFGSGFIFFEDEEGAYVLTCAHVVKDVGGIDQVKVENRHATVIYHSENGYADDLAILKVEGLKNLPNLPLGNFRRELCNRKFLTKFRIHGYSEFDSRNRIYSLDNLQGYLGDKRKLKGKNQPSTVDSWILKIDQDHFLKPGNSGSPVIDTISYNVLGIVTHLEGKGQNKGKDGRAVSIATLEEVWEEIPPGLLRKVYYLEPLSELLRTIFTTEDQLCHSFYPVFPEVFEPKLDLLKILVRIEYLVIYCHRHNELDQLIDIINNTSQKKYKKWICKIDPSYQKNTILKHYCESNICVIIRRLFIKSSQTENSRIKIEFLGDYPESPEVTEARIRAVVGLLRANGEKIDRGQVKIIVVKKGSVKIEIELPSEALDKLIELYEQDRSVLERELGIIYLTEILKERFKIKNIQALLKQGFETEEILAICNDNFSPVAELIKPGSSKVEIINSLIEYLHQKSQIQDFLSLARKRKPQAYEKFRPYYKVPRRPGQRANSTFQKRVRMLLAGVMGVGVSTLGVFSLSQLTESLTRLNSSGNSGIAGLIGLVFFLGLTFLGDITGQAILVGTRGRRGETVGRLAIFSYSIGCSIGFIWYDTLQFNDQNHFISLFMIALAHLPQKLIFELSNGIGMVLGGSRSYQLTR